MSWTLKRANEVGAPMSDALRRANEVGETWVM